MDHLKTHTNISSVSSLLPGEVAPDGHSPKGLGIHKRETTVWVGTGRASCPSQLTTRCYDDVGLMQPQRGLNTR